jgi:hypothetical protein
MNGASYSVRDGYELLREFVATRGLGRQFFEWYKSLGLLKLGEEYVPVRLVRLDRNHDASVGYHVVVLEVRDDGRTGRDIVRQRVMEHYAIGGVPLRFEGDESLRYDGAWIADDQPANGYVVLLARHTVGGIK